MHMLICMCTPKHRAAEARADVAETAKIELTLALARADDEARAHTALHSTTTASSASSRLAFAGQSRGLSGDMQAIVEELQHKVGFV